MEHQAAELAAFTRRHRAADLIGRGLGFILLSPLVFFLSITMTALLESVMPFLIGLVGALTSGLAGSVLVLQGAMQHVQASRELRRISERIPSARLLR